MFPPSLQTTLLVGQDAFRGVLTATPPAALTPTAAGVGVGEVANRSAAVYDDKEYDEDLAQLDMLLHYVNNLSASLEFLAWENKRM